MIQFFALGHKSVKLIFNHELIAQHDQFEIYLF